MGRGSFGGKSEGGDVANVGIGAGGAFGKRVAKESMGGAAFGGRAAKAEVGREAAFGGKGTEAGKGEGHEEFGFGAGNKDGGGDTEFPSVERCGAEYVLQRLGRKQALHGGVQRRLRGGRDNCLRLGDVCIGLDTEQGLTKKHYDISRLRSRIKSLQRRDAFLDEVPEEHPNGSRLFP